MRTDDNSDKHHRAENALFPRRQVQVALGNRYNVADAQNLKHRYRQDQPAYQYQGVVEDTELCNVNS